MNVNGINNQKLLIIVTYALSQEYCQRKYFKTRTIIIIPTKFSHQGSAQVRILY